MNNFEIKKITDKKYLLEMIQVDNEGNIVSNGLSFEKSELRELYMKLRDIFTTEK